VCRNSLEMSVAVDSIEMSWIWLNLVPAFCTPYQQK
jgi:hypothetical protein